MLIQTSLRPRMVVRNARAPKHFCNFVITRKRFCSARAKVKQQKNARRFRFGGEYYFVSAAMCTTRDHNNIVTSMIITI